MAFLSRNDDRIVNQAYYFMSMNAATPRTHHLQLLIDVALTVLPIYTALASLITLRVVLVFFLKIIIVTSAALIPLLIDHLLVVESENFKYLWL